MNLKQAVAAAKDHFVAAFADEGNLKPTLEEVWFDDMEKVWHVTLGTRRPDPYSPTGPLSDPLGLRELGLTADHIVYKEVRVSDVDGKVLSIKIRLPERV